MEKRGKLGGGCLLYPQCMFRAAPPHTHILAVFQEDIEVVVPVQSGVRCQALQKAFVHCHGLLEDGQVLPAADSRQDWALGLPPSSTSSPSSREGRGAPRAHSRLQLLLHFGKFLPSNGTVPFPELLQLFPRSLKVWPRRSRGDLGREGAG